METRNILTPSLAVFCMELQQAIDEGFRLDEENLPTTFGICYEGILVKDETRSAVLEAFKEAPGEMDFSVITKPQEAKRGRPTSKA